MLASCRRLCMSARQTPIMGIGSAHLLGNGRLFRGANAHSEVRGAALSTPCTRPQSHLTLRRPEGPSRRVGYSALLPSFETPRCARLLRMRLSEIGYRIPRCARDDTVTNTTP